MAKILIIEDEISLRETISYNLIRQDYIVEAVGDGVLGVETARKTKPELIILDIMLPGMDGFEVCRILRQEMSVPILMLTAREDEIDRVIGLEIGADDYMTKPFSMRELMARVKAHLRRERIIRDDVSSLDKNKVEEKRLEFGNLIIDEVRHEVLLDYKPLALKPQEFELLLFLAHNRGRALTRDYLLERVWGWEFSGNSRTVDVHIRWLREKIEVDASKPQRITTLRSSGYRFEG
jgi:DNA-binding response OmpR family regulator